MMRPIIALTALLGSAVLHGGAFAADAAKGEVLAKRWCATCHVVAEGQRVGNADVPTFASIGSRNDFDAKAVAFFLMAPHPKMPSMSLSRAEAADLAAYIRAQGK